MPHAPTSDSDRDFDLRWGESGSERRAWAVGILATETDPLTPESTPEQKRRAAFAMLASEDFLPVMPQEHAVETVLDRSENCAAKSASASATLIIRRPNTR
ncbi:MAG: hypothetical protein QM811_18430 [Pirellulales bacterium]